MCGFGDFWQAIARPKRGRREEIGEDGGKLRCHIPWYGFADVTTDFCVVRLQDALFDEVLFEWNLTTRVGVESRCWGMATSLR